MHRVQIERETKPAAQIAHRGSEEGVGLARLESLLSRTQGDDDDGNTHAHTQIKTTCALLLDSWHLNSIPVESVMDDTMAEYYD